MPPPHADSTLSDREIEVLGRFILQGAEFEDHWAYRVPVRPEPPAVADADWARGDLDRFVLARLEQEGLAPSAETDRRTLVRRLSLDLTGLPPTPAEVNAFLADDRPDAYERVVNCLLASDRYGEHMARSWLDAARYADTNGYHIDNERTMWRWRDWVIEAFNRNQPFDEFTVEQLAGDLLSDPTPAQLLATGFHRNHMINFEGGAVPEEYRVQYVFDRTDTTATVWMGLTAGCAKCHDHKFDPVSQREYYQLAAFFNTVAEVGLDGSQGNAEPRIPAPDPAQRAVLEELDAELAPLDALLDDESEDAVAAQAAWQAEWDRCARSRDTPRRRSGVSGCPFRALRRSGSRASSQVRWAVSTVALRQRTGSSSTCSRCPRTSAPRSRWTICGAVSAAATGRRGSPRRLATRNSGAAASRSRRKCRPR